MQFRNRRGTPVDPVPFFVVVASVFLVTFSFGPMYLLALDLQLPVSLGVCTIVFLGASVLAYYQLVWLTRPEFLAEVPAATRLRRLAYAVVTGIALLGLLSIPLFLQ
ncbi:hypothetical protein [Haloarchaeobius sp. HME9146]|uniref:hypothetical protein n=1 Tax=Haloarchaeobius sp. HME9146 TaxID=2978732 RepID=UPI0021C13979|nr:hypothetical protein [Haloarchaeobius sp. HME9146]MCT9094721.1 hypothetical protein [Haloarchaeobius sp. HME9146]